VPLNGYSLSNNETMRRICMTKQQSFTKIENELLPKFRRRIGTAESTEDVKKFYVYTMQDLFNRVFSGKIDLEYEDVVLLPDQAPSFSFNERIQGKEDFTSVWNNSDLPHIVSRFTDSVLNHLKHLEKNPAKTESKIRM
jgi:hypothetical protein